MQTQQPQPCRDINHSKTQYTEYSICNTATVNTHESLTITDTMTQAWHHRGGGDSSGLDAKYPPQLSVGWRPHRGGGGVGRSFGGGGGGRGGPARVRVRAMVRGRVRTMLRVGVGFRVKVGFKDSFGVQSGQKFPPGAFGARVASGAFGAHGLLRLAPFTTNCWPEAP